MTATASGSMEATSLVHAVPRLTESRVTAIACRALDVVVAAVLLVLLSPLLLAIALAIRLDSPGWPVFRQKRVGRGLVPFTVNKFRSMYASVGHETHRKYVLELIESGGDKRPEPAPGGFYKLRQDPRITRVGALARKSSLDELPQLWNVLRGDMSLVGPRPSIPYEVERYPQEWYVRFAVRPGITGLWQVSGRSQLTWEEMIQLDLEYVRRRSLWLNLSILLRTIPVVLIGKGAA
jgi:lipopolysaccharide/colanic/teichoic acid biosynthesis glycosyltransferase